MLRAPKHSSLCVFHARQEQQILEADRVAAELANLTGEFRTATDLNHALGKLFALLAAQRIPVRNAVALGYLAQLILQTLSSVKWEAERAQGLDAWERMLRRYFGPHAAAGQPARATEPQSPAPQLPNSTAALPVAPTQGED
jgi:hypothetical protein